MLVFSAGSDRAEWRRTCAVLATSASAWRGSPASLYAAPRDVRGFPQAGAAIGPDDRRVERS